MPSIQRPLSGDLLLFDLEGELAWASDPVILGRHGRNARTLLKAGPLRVTLVVIGAGGSIPEHAAEGPITVQPIRGRIRFRTGAATREIGPGELLCLGAGVAHAVESDEGGAFLLTVALAGAGAAGDHGLSTADRRGG